MHVRATAGYSFATDVGVGFRAVIVPPWLQVLVAASTIITLPGGARGAGWVVVQVEHVVVVLVRKEALGRRIVAGSVPVR